jgi:hypothetical protein
MGKIYLLTEETSEEVLSTLADGVDIGFGEDTSLS